MNWFINIFNGAALKQKLLCRRKYFVK